MQHQQFNKEEFEQEGQNQKLFEEEMTEAYRQFMTAHFCEQCQLELQKK
jgi:hypothetical protein